MPCNLAVTITKGVVAPDHLKKLLTPQIIQQLVTAFCNEHPDFKQHQPIRTSSSSDGVVLYVGRLDRRLIITNDQVKANFPRYAQEEGERLATLLTHLLAKGADKLFAAQVQKALATFGGVQAQTATVDNEGEKQQVRVFTLEV